MSSSGPISIATASSVEVSPDSSSFSDVDKTSTSAGCDIVNTGWAEQIRQVAGKAKVDMH